MGGSWWGSARGRSWSTHPQTEADGAIYRIFGPEVHKCSARAPNRGENSARPILAGKGGPSRGPGPVLSREAATALASQHGPT